MVGGEWGAQRQGIRGRISLRLENWGGS